MGYSLEDWVAEACARHYLALEALEPEVLQLRYEKERHAVPRLGLLAPDRAEAADAAEVRAWVAGASAAVRVPLRRAFTFSSVAGAIYPLVVSPHWLAGYEAALGKPLLSAEFAPGLHSVWVVEDDYGFAAVPLGRFESWGCTRDRVASAGRSNLYHRTATLAPTRVDVPVVMEQFGSNDTFDSARALLLGDLYFERVERGILFAVPHQDCILFADDAPDAAAALSRAALALFSEGRCPVSPHVFRAFNRGFAAL